MTAEAFRIRREVADGTIYAGQVTRLGQVFNVFAAPANLPEFLSYNDTVREVAKLNTSGRAFCE